MAAECQRIAAGRQMRDHEAELKELRQTVRSAVQAGLSDVAEAASSTMANAPANLAELEALLRELGDRLSEAVDEAEDAVASHPLSSVGAAFVLGFALGRLSKRS